MASLAGFARGARNSGLRGLENGASKRTVTAPAAVRTVVAIQHGQQLRSFVSKAEDGSIIRDHLPPARGLYDPFLEKDSCGTG